MRAGCLCLWTIIGAACDELKAVYNPLTPYRIEQIANTLDAEVLLCSFKSQDGGCWANGVGSWNLKVSSSGSENWEQWFDAKDSAVAASFNRSLKAACLISKVPSTTLVFFKDYKQLLDLLAEEEKKENSTASGGKRTTKENFAAFSAAEAAASGKDKNSKTTSAATSRETTTMKNVDLCLLKEATGTPGLLAEGKEEVTDKDTMMMKAALNMAQEEKIEEEKKEISTASGGNRTTKERGLEVIKVWNTSEHAMQQYVFAYQPAQTSLVQKAAILLASSRYFDKHFNM